MNALSLVSRLSLLLGLTLGACGSVVPVAPDGGPGPGSDAGPGPGVLPLAASFEMVAAFELESSFPLPGLGLDEHRFILRLDDVDATGTAAIAGAAGQAVSVPFARQSDGVRTLSSALSLAVDLLQGTSCALYDLVYEQMQLTPVDDDGDGRVDRVQGTASGTLELDTFSGTGLRFTATLEGALDRTPPHLLVLGSEQEHNVLTPIRIEASEPLPANTRLSLLFPDSNDQPIELAGGDPLATTSFTSPSFTLPFGASLIVARELPVRDLAGNESPDELPRTVQTMADPGLFAEDGFESPLRADLRGPAEVVASVGNLPALTGLQSLRMEPGSRLTVVIPRGPNDTRYALQARTLHHDLADTDLFVKIAVGVPGTEIRAESTVAFDIPPSAETGDDVWPYAGELREIDGVLPDTAGDTLVLSIQISGPQSACLDGSPSELGLLIDDLRLE